MILHISDDNITPKGVLTIESRDSRTGELVDSSKQDNVLVLHSRRAIVRGITGNPLGTIDKLLIGDDYGNGTPSNPEPANETYDRTTMSILYTYPDELVLGYASETKAMFSATLSGKDIMEEHPNEDSVYFTSAALHTKDGEVFSYIRFPQKSISTVLDITIIWEIGYD